MTDIVFYKEGSGYVVERLGADGAQTLGRGRTKAEALGSLILADMGEDAKEYTLEINVLGEYNSYEDYMQSRLEKIGKVDQ